MGCFYSKFQKQYKYCDTCNSNKITLLNVFIVEKHMNQGSISFVCNNGHKFHVNTWGKCEYNIYSDCINQGVKILK